VRIGQRYSLTFSVNCDLSGERDIRLACETLKGVERQTQAKEVNLRDHAEVSGITFLDVPKSKKLVCKYGGKSLCNDGEKP
jgi:hypothetical protein